MIFRDAHGLHVLCTDDVAGFLRWNVLRVDGQPHRVEAMSTGEGRNKLATPCGISVTSELLFYLVSDVPRISKFEGRIDSQADSSHYGEFSGVPHLKLISRTISLDRVSRYFLYKDQFQIAVNKAS